MSIKITLPTKQYRNKILCLWCLYWVTGPVRENEAESWGKREKGRGRERTRGRECPGDRVPGCCRQQLGAGRALCPVGAAASHSSDSRAVNTCSPFPP